MTSIRLVVILGINSILVWNTVSQCPQRVSSSRVLKCVLRISINSEGGHSLRAPHFGQVMVGRLMLFSFILSLLFSALLEGG
jgi:hypothetical protein